MIRGSSLREFAKNSRVFKAFAPRESALRHNFLPFADSGWLGRPAQGLEFPLRSLSYLKRGIERCHLGATARYRRRVLEFRWHPIS